MSMKITLAGDEGWHLYEDLNLNSVVLRTGHSPDFVYVPMDKDMLKVILAALLDLQAKNWVLVSDDAGGNTPGRIDNQIAWLEERMRNLVGDAKVDLNEKIIGPVGLDDEEEDV